MNVVHLVDTRITNFGEDEVVVTVYGIKRTFTTEQLDEIYFNPRAALEKYDLDPDTAMELLSVVGWI